MKELSIFIDESGDFGAYEPHSPIYLLTLVFHDRAIDISYSLAMLRDAMKQRGIPNHTVHAGPLIRREIEYRNFSIVDRKKAVRLPVPLCPHFRYYISPDYC